MLDNLLSETIKKEKDPDRKLFNIIMIIAVSVLFSILINVLFDNSNEYKLKNKELQNDFNSTMRNDRKTIDSLKDANFNDRLNFYIEKDKYSKQLDSLINNLQKIR